MAKDYPPLSLDKELRFTKHKGSTIRKVIENDPEWITWSVKEGFKYDNEAYELIIEKRLVPDEDL